MIEEELKTLRELVNKNGFNVTLIALGKVARELSESYIDTTFGQTMSEVAGVVERATEQVESIQEPAFTRV